MKNEIKITPFIEIYQQLTERFDEIRLLYRPNLFPLDTISIEGDKIAFNCSDSFRGSMEYETYYYTDNELNRPNDEWAAIIEKGKQDAEIARQKAKQVFEQQQIDHRKHQYEQLKKEFEK